MLKKIIFISLTALLCGCASDPYSLNNKTLDDRNAFSEKPLVVPPLSSDYPFYKNITNDANYNSNIAFQLVFNQNYNDYKNQIDQLALTNDDTNFLIKAGASTDYSAVRTELDKESLGIINKNNSFIHKILFWQVNEGIKDPKSEYIKLN
ncbi:hypothetical protein ACFX5K_02930 [Rickettsiales bacterium LUAb2]